MQAHERTLPSQLADAALAAAAAGAGLATIVTAGPIVGLALVVVAVAAWVALSHPGLALAVLAGIIVANVAEVATTVHGLPPIGGLLVPALAAVLLVRALDGREDLTPAVGLSVAAVIYATAPALGLFRVEDPAATAADLVALAKNLLVLVVFAGFLTTFERIRMVAWGLVVAAGAMAALSLVQVATGTFDNAYLGFAQAELQQITVDAPDSWRLSGPLGDPNFFAQVLVTATAPAAALAVAARGAGARLLAAAIVPALIAIVVLTFSRGALLGLGVMALAGVLLMPQRWTMLGLGAAAATVLVAMAPGAALERFSETLQAAQAVFGGTQFVLDPALSQRLSVMTGAIHMVGDHPLLGIGAGQFERVYPAYALAHGLDIGSAKEAHSMFLEAAAEGGLLGLGLFVGSSAAALGIAARGVARLRRAGRGRDAALVVGLMIGFLGYLTTAVFLHGDYARIYWMQVAVLVSSGIVAARAPGGRASATHPARRPAPTPRRPASMPLILDALHVLWRRKFLILAVGALCAGFAGLLAISSSRPFVAESTLMYRFGREYYQMGPGDERRSWTDPVMITLDNALFTEMHLIGAHDLIRRTVDGLDEDALAAVRARAPYPDWAVELLPRTLGTRRPATPADPDALAEAIGEAMTIERVQGATLVTVTLRHGSAETADFLLARHIETYLARRNALFSPDSDRFFDEELAARRAEQARVLGEIAALHATYGISDLEDQRTLYRDRLASFEAGLRESPADPALLEASADARDGLARLASFENGLRPLEAELMRIAESVETLASEREAWSLTRAYRDEVAPTVDVVDVRPAALERVGLAPTASVATAGVFGMLLAWVMAIAVLFVRRLRAAPAGEAGSDTAQAGATTLSEASGREGTSSA